jgi:hypothetical protein
VAAMLFVIAAFSEVDFQSSVIHATKDDKFVSSCSDKLLHAMIYGNSLLSLDSFPQNSNYEQGYRQILLMASFRILRTDFLRSL